ncbi:MAG: hypothetical protein ACK41T_06895 [Pseudobdellovibrio sp.]
MKFKYVYYSIALVFLVVGLFIWKLNDVYRSEKSVLRQTQVQAQSTALRTALVNQLAQLKNILSSYTVQIDESQINWVQIKPFYVLAQVQETAEGQIIVSKMFAQTGSQGERWSQEALQLYLGIPIKNQEPMRVQLFLDQAGTKHLALTFFDQPKQQGLSRSGIIVVGDSTYFQKFFDTQRTSQVTQALVVQNQIVVGHSQSDYIGSISDEAKLANDKFFKDKQELRGTNLTLLSYSAKNSKNAGLNIPTPILGLILGLGFLVSGLLVFMARPDNQRKNTVNTEAKEVKVQDDVPTPKLKLTERPQEVSAVKEFKLQAFKKPVIVPLILPERTEPIRLQIQACAQQALFNVNRKLKQNSITVEKDFASVESVILDQSRYVKVFENIYLTLVEYIATEPKLTLRRLDIRSYDQEMFSVVEVHTPITGVQFSQELLAELGTVGCVFSEEKNESNEVSYRFSFPKAPPEVPSESELKEDLVKIEEKPSLETVKASLVGEPKVQTKKNVQDDLDIDAILSLEDDEVTYVPEVELQMNEVEKEIKEDVHVKKNKVDLEKEMQPVKYKLDDVVVVKEPDIEMDELDKKNKADQFKVKIRRPGKA